MTDTALATVAEQVKTHPLVVLRERLVARRDELKNMLPDDIRPDVFIRAAVTAATLNPEILACTFASIWTSLVRACRDGLLPDGQDGAIVPYKSTATWIPMYGGLLRRFRRSGQFKWATANVVRKGEEFAHYIDEQGEHFKHVPGDDFAAEIVKIYAMAQTKEGGLFVTVLPIAEANKIRNMSRTKRDDAPWKLWPEEMYKKTAIRRLSKSLPQARDLLPEELPDDDEDETEVALPAPTNERPRASGAGAALAQFAGSPEAAETSGITAATVGKEGGAQEDASDTADNPSQSAAAYDPQADSDSAASSPLAAADPAADRPTQAASAADSMLAAYERGKQAKAAGDERKVPGEYYKAPDATKLAHSWLRGWDGQRLE